MEYASNGKGNLAVTLGSIGLGLGVLNGSGNGILGGVLGGNQQYVGRETFDLSMQLAKSERENAILAADLSSEKKMVEVYNSLNEKINRVVENQSAVNAAQAVTNTSVTANLAVLNNNIAQLQSLTKLVVPNSSVCPGWNTTTTQ